MGTTLVGGVSKGAISGAGLGTALGSVIPGVGNLVGAGIGALAGGLLGSLPSLFGNKGSSAETMDIKDAYNLEMYNTMKDLFMMNQQNNYNERNLGLQAMYNAQSEERQFNYQNQLADKQFEQNKWFVQNAYQNTVQDLYKAGINPLLAIQNGSNVGSVGMGSATALSASLPSVSAVTGSGVDPASMMSASANSANANTARRQLAYNAMNTFADVVAKTSASAKALEEAKTQDSVRQVNESQALLNGIRKTREDFEYMLDKKYGDRDRLLNQLAVLKDMEFKTITAENGRISARAQQTSAKSQEYNSRTQRFDTIMKNSNYVGNPLVGKMYIPSSLYNDYLNVTGLYK